MANGSGRGPRTWRCLNPACGEVYCDLVGGTPRFHTCRRPGRLELAAGAPAPNPADLRDENIHQDHPGGPVRIRAGGAGRELLAYGDLVSEATMAEYAELGSRPALEAGPAAEDDMDHRGRGQAMPARAE